ncbi:hypothetical protein QQS21_002549 [Conoideocrella luteorostrata]|uniref:WW domain-containing oxidoreductase n=1 Tax=Conoideocrella luteorostrata TaxID=1105319 RepID=A0AAJ0CUX3_9HYPO|nr:hypothetical protein QQS21_002549 [Conoideocrella luteorostrata]
MPEYRTAHANPQGPGDSRPTALQVVQDNDMEGKLVGKNVVVTGASSGLGVETARAFKATGATLFLTARNIPRARAALAEIWDDSTMHLIEMDQASLQSVQSGAEQILSKANAVHILIANAGIMAVPELQLTKDGFETQFATNYLSHFLLFNLLRPALVQAASTSFNPRVVVVSAAAHRVSGVGEPGDYNFEKTSYEPWVAYARSKTAFIYMANEIDRRYAHLGLHANSLHPGIVGTGIGKYLSAEMVDAIAHQQALVIKSPAQGAATTLCAAIGKEWETRGGVYLNDCASAEAGELDGDPSKGTYVGHTYDVGAASRLWESSLQMVDKFLAK